MERATSFSIVKMFSVVLFSIFMTSLFSIIAFADTTAYLGTDRVNIASGEQNFTVAGYVTYAANNTQTLDVTAMEQWIENDGVYDVDVTRFVAHNGTGDNYTMTEWSLGDPITGGTSGYIEADWHSVCDSRGTSPVYQKNSDDRVAVTDMASGYSYGLMGGWLSYWFTTYREDTFHA